jgi:hypothetical protein
MQGIPVTTGGDFLVPTGVDCPRRRGLLPVMRSTGRAAGPAVRSRTNWAHNRAESPGWGGIFSPVSAGQSRWGGTFGRIQLVRFCRRVHTLLIS